MSGVVYINSLKKMNQSFLRSIVVIRFLFDFKSLTYGFLDLLSLIAGFVMIIQIFIISSYNQAKSTWRSLTIFILPFFACTCIFGLINSSDNLGTFRFQIKLFVLIIALKYCKYLEISEINSWKNIFSNLILISALISIFEFSIKINILGKDSFTYLNQRGSGFYLWPNIACISFGIVLVFTFLNSKYLRFEKILRVTILIFGILSTSSLAGTIGSVLAILYLGWKKGTRLFFGIATLGSIFIFYVAGRTKFGERFSKLRIPSTEMVVAGRSEDSLTWRFIQWRRVFKEIMKSPFFGHGLGSSSDLNLTYGYLPHNDYLRVLFDVGFIGLFALLTTLILYWVTLNKANIGKLKQTEIKAYLIVLLISCFAENVMNQTTIYLMIPFFISFRGLEHDYENTK